MASPRYDAKSADNPVSLLPVSLLGEGLDWVVVDEAARLRPDIWDSYLSQRLLDKKGWALFISTPKGRGFFYDLYRDGQGRDSAFESWSRPSITNPFLSKESVGAERLRLPARVFSQEYGAEFIEGSGAVFRLTPWFRDAIAFESLTAWVSSQGYRIAKLKAH